MSENFDRPTEWGILVGPLSIKFFSCPNLFAIQKKRPLDRTILATFNFSKAFVIFLKLLIRSGTLLSFPRYWLWVFRLALSAGPDPFCQTVRQRSSSVALEAARFELDAESLRAPFLAQPSSSYMSTTTLKPSPRGPNTHSMLMI